MATLKAIVLAIALATAENRACGLCEWERASKNLIKANGTEGGEQERAEHRRIKVNVRCHNPKDSPTPAEGGRLVHTALGLAINVQGDRHVNNPGASRDKDEASVVAVGNGRNLENADRPGFCKAKRSHLAKRQELANSAVEAQGKAERIDALGLVEA